MPDAAAWPDEWQAGMKVTGRMRPFRVLPGWRHTIHVVTIDDQGHRAETEERGAFLTRSAHVVAAAELPDGRTHYTDRITIDAGPWTPAVWLVADAFYRHRHVRLRAAVRLLSGVLHPRLPAQADAR